MSHVSAWLNLTGDKMVSLGAEISECRRDLTTIQRQELPFVVAKTVTDLAKGSQGKIQRDMRQRFTIRSHWPIRGVRIEPAKKSDMRRYGQCEGAVKHLDHYMTLHEEGGEKENLSRGEPSGSRKRTAIPHYQSRRSLRTGTGRLKQSAKKYLQKPSSTTGLFTRKRGVHRKPKPFIISASGNRSLVVIRRNKHRDNLKYLFVLADRPRVKPRFEFEKTVRVYARENIRRRFAENMRSAMAPVLAQSVRGV